MRSNVNFTDCFDKSLGQSCTLGCEAGYTPVGEPAVQCRLNGTFSEPTLLCVPASCGDLSADPDFPPNIVGHTCTGAVFGESCIANCQDGYRLVGSEVQLACRAVSVSAGFTLSNGEPAQPPTCAANPCDSSGFPTARGVTPQLLGHHNRTTLLGRRTTRLQRRERHHVADVWQ
ncbi:unnamed protein product [Effrenium voratum]|nr:unnamed protein product [Effrenium voratum]